MTDAQMTYQRVGAERISGRNASRIMHSLARHRKVVVGLTILAVVVAAAVFAHWLAPRDPQAQNLSQAHTPPFWLAGGQPEYPLGTDYIGRDVLSRLIYGARVSLLVGFGGVLIASLLGIAFGLLAGYFGGWVEAIVMRIADTILAVPWILFVLFVVGILGSSLVNVIVIFGITDFPLFTRTVRGEVLAVREQQFIDAAVSIGAQPWRVLRSHVLPNIAGTVITVATFELASMVLWEASLGFLGLSVPPTIPSWGNMMAEGRSYLRSDWWLATFPGIAVMLLTLGINLTGDGLRFVLDPKSRGRE
ncbi:MAG: ABC transporter permease [Anaerolineae bacterium]|nr:ABC transporter permease [Anaerolineae bacterium]